MSTSKMVWAGRVLSALPSLMMLGSGGAKLAAVPEVVDMLSNKLGYPASSLPVIGALEVGSVVLYLIPQTSVLGAIVITGYLGGAIASHVRISDPGWPTVLVLATMVWAGLGLRDSRLMALLPIRKSSG